MKRLTTALICLLFAGAAAGWTQAQTAAPKKSQTTAGAKATPAALPAQDVTKLVVNLKYSRTSGVVRLNGIPIKRFGHDTPGGRGPATLVIGLGLADYGIDGVNALTVEAKPAGAAKGASTELLLFVTGDNPKNALKTLDHPLFDKKVDGLGTIQCSVTLTNVPYRYFDDATPWHGDPEAVLPRVRGLHKAFTEQNMKTIADFLRPAYDSSENAKRFGNFDKNAKEFETSLKASKVAELPAKLHVKSFYDGRLFQVTDANGQAPIRAASIKVDEDGQPEESMEVGAFWCNHNGTWYPLN